MNKIGIALAGIALLVGVSICLTGAAHSDAGADAAPDKLRQLCENILNQSSRGEKKGFDLVAENMAYRATSILDKEIWNASAHRQIGEMLDFQGKYGAFLGCELAEEKNFTSTLRRYVYLAKYEQNVMCWTFTFYRPHDEWKILGVRYKDLQSDPLPY
jgi:hypothetical protein